jgi:transposase-like zinc-binding protein
VRKQQKRNKSSTCAHTVIAYNSCGNRNCPKCQAAAARQWLVEREAELKRHFVPCCFSDAGPRTPHPRHAQRPRNHHRSRYRPSHALSCRCGPGGDATNVVTDYVRARGESRSQEAKFVKVITAAYRMAFKKAASTVTTPRENWARPVHHSRRLPVISHERRQRQRCGRRWLPSPRRAGPQTCASFVPARGREANTPSPRCQSMRGIDAAS